MVHDVFSLCGLDKGTIIEEHFQIHVDRVRLDCELKAEEKAADYIRDHEGDFIDKMREKWESKMA